jgi:hypothetical protein
MANGPFAEETEISMLDDPDMNVELGGQASRIPVQRRAGTMNFRTGRHG